MSYYDCAKSFRIRSLSGPYFTAFGLNTERCRECGKIQARKTPNADTFHAVYAFSEHFTHNQPYFVCFSSLNYLTLVFNLSYINALDSLCIKYLLSFKN